MVFIKHSSLRSLRWCQLRFYHTLRRRYGGLTSDHAEQYSDATSLEKHEETSKTNMPRFSAVERDPGNAFKQYLMQPDTPPDGKLIRVAILGAPNAGKSTFINKIMGWKVNSVSKKVHTTKKNTNSVFTVDNTQIIFVDTPGVISVREKLKHQVDASVLKEPESSLEEADLVGVVVDGSNRWTRNTLHPEIIKTLLLYRNVPSFLILNKVDEVTQKYLLLEATRLLTAGLIGGKKFSTSAYTKNKERTLESLQKDPQKMFLYLESKYGKLDVKHSQSGERLAAESKRENKEKDEEDKLFNIRNVIENEKKLSKDVQRMKEKLSDVAENSSTRLSNQPPATLKHLRNKPPATLKDLRNQPPATSKDLHNQNPATWKDLHNHMQAFSKDFRYQPPATLTDLSKGDNLLENSMKTVAAHPKTFAKPVEITEDTWNLCNNIEQNVLARFNKLKMLQNNEGLMFEYSSEDSSSEMKHADEDSQSNLEVNSTDTEFIEEKINVSVKLDQENVDTAPEGSLMVSAEDDLVVQDKSYQSDFLKQLFSIRHKEYSIPRVSKVDKEDEEWRKKVEEATKAARDMTKWPHFERVFITSSISGTGIDDVKEYLLEQAKPADWVYHSSVVTEQHPYEIALMVVRQALLDHVAGWIPYKMEPVISYWDVYDDNSLHVSIDLNVNCNEHMRQIIGHDSETIKAISYDAKQALMDVFHCEVKFRLCIYVKKPRGSRR